MRPTTPTPLAEQTQTQTLKGQNMMSAGEEEDQGTGICDSRQVAAVSSSPGLRAASTADNLQQPPSSGPSGHPLLSRSSQGSKVMGKEGATEPDVVEIEDSSDEDLAGAGDRETDSSPTERNSSWFDAMLNNNDRARISCNDDTSAAWLTDNIVNAVLDFLVSCTENDKTVSSLVLKPGQVFPISPSRASLIFNRGSVIAILHVDKIHWICTHIDSAARSVIVYDSVKQPVGETVALDVVEAALGSFVRTAFGALARKWTFKYCDESPKQGDLSSCGVFSLLVALCLACHVPVPRSANAAFWRRFFAAMVTPRSHPKTLLPDSIKQQIRPSPRNRDQCRNTAPNVHETNRQLHPATIGKEVAEQLLEDLDLARLCVKILRKNGERLDEPLSKYVSDVKSSLNKLKPAISSLDRRVGLETSRPVEEGPSQALRLKADKAREFSRFWGRRSSVLKSGLRDLGRSGLIRIIEDDVDRIKTAMKRCDEEAAGTEHAASEAIETLSKLTLA